MVVSIHSFTPNRVEELTMNYCCDMLAAVIFQSEASAEAVLPAAGPSFLLSPLSEVLYLLISLDSPTSYFASFLPESIAGFIAIENLAPYANDTISFST